MTYRVRNIVIAVVLAGILKTGDHVDVVANFRYKLTGGSSQVTYAATRIVLRNVKVLRAPTGPGAGSKLGGSFDSKFPIVLPRKSTSKCSDGRRRAATALMPGR